MTELIPLVEKIPPIGGKVGAPLRKPKRLLADRGYDSDKHRVLITAGKGIKTLIARKNTPHGSGLGVFRYVAEQSIALVHQFRRLKIRYDKRDDIHEAFLTIAEVVICWRRLAKARGYF